MPELAIITPSSPEDLCQAAVDAHGMPVLYGLHADEIAAAHELYALSVEFCGKAGLPLSSIRVECASWGSRPWRPTKGKKYKTKTLDKYPHAVALGFDGARWIARVERRVPPPSPSHVTSPLFKDVEGKAPVWFGGPAWAMTFLVLDDKPDKLVRAKKEKDVYRVSVAQWYAARDNTKKDSRNKNNEQIGIATFFDPWNEGLKDKKYLDTRLQFSGTKPPPVQVVKEGTLSAREQASARRFLEQEASFKVNPLLWNGSWDEEDD